MAVFHFADEPELFVRHSCDGAHSRASTRPKGHSEKLCVGTMQFDMLFDDRVYTKACQSRTTGDSSTDLYLKILQRLTACEDAAQKMVRNQMRLAVSRLTSEQLENREVLVNELASALSFFGLKAEVMKTTGNFNAGVLSFRHSYLQVKIGDIRGYEQTLIVEPQLGSEFQIVRPTSQYERLMEVLPREFVGTPSQLENIVEFMCERMGDSFREHHMSTPPWRQVKSILSRWDLSQSRNSSPTSPSSTELARVQLDRAIARPPLPQPARKTGSTVCSIVEAKRKGLESVVPIQKPSCNQAPKVAGMLKRGLNNPALHADVGLHSIFQAKPNLVMKIKC